MTNYYLISAPRAIFLALMLSLSAACSGKTQITQTLPATGTRSVAVTKALTPTAVVEVQGPTETSEPATRTPLPTLSPVESDAQVREWLQTNAGCALPCWWGIRPGETTVDETQTILEPLLGAVQSDVRYGFTPTGGLLLMRPQPNGLQVGVQYLAKDNIVTMVYINTAMTKDVYGLVYGDPKYEQMMSAYTLEKVLTVYGKPEAVMIRSFSNLAAEENPTQTLLYYPEKGIIVEYFSPNGLLIEDGATVLPTCPPKGHISLRLFDPASGMSLDELMRLDDSLAKYKDISEATNMDLNAFYEAYRQYDENSLQSLCPATLKTPEAIWPAEYSNP